MSHYSVAHLDEIEEVTDGREPWRPVRHHLGITAFGINTWTAANAGDRILNEHDESDGGGPQEELYFVYQGRARFEIDGEQLDAPAGTFVFARPAAKRTAFAEEPRTTIIAVGGVPGEAYQASGWELWAPVHQFYAAGEYAQAADRGRELLETGADYPAVVYNVACSESLAGRKEDALEHLRLAIDRWDRARTLAAEDSDFDPIRDDPKFKELVS
jgi:tetratricopeptide (TPR) repeat protein